MAGHENVIKPTTLPSEEWLTEQITNPGLPAGTEQLPLPQLVQEKELIQPGTGQIPVTPKAERDPTATATAQTAIAQTATAQAATVQAATAQDAYKVEKIEVDDQRVAEQGTVTTESTVRGQLEQLMDDVESDDAPWADEAIRKANQAMSARGMGNSSIAAAAITQSVLEAAMPIAQYDAQVYGTMNIQNLRNRQETMLSNQAASNVAKNLNAKSVNEASQFMANMRDSIIKLNVLQQNAMSEANATRATQVSLAGAAAVTQVSLAGAAAVTQVSLANAAQTNIDRQYQEKRADEVEKFNATNTLNIAKADAEWRRTINTANTAAQNAANMINAQNHFNISQQAQANLWQQSRDVFSWANQSATNEKDRAFKITMYALGRQDYLDDLAEDERNAIRGGLADMIINIMGPIAKDWAAGLSK